MHWLHILYILTIHNLYILTLHILYILTFHILYILTLHILYILTLHILYILTLPVEVASPVWFSNSNEIFISSCDMSWFFSLISSPYLRTVAARLARRDVGSLVSVDGATSLPVLFTGAIVITLSAPDGTSPDESSLLLVTELAVASGSSVKLICLCAETVCVSSVESLKELVMDFSKTSNCKVK